jgi:hypothetical protein
MYLCQIRNYRMTLNVALGMSLPVLKVLFGIFLAEGNLVNIS